MEAEYNNELAQNIINSNNDFIKRFRPLIVSNKIPYRNRALSVFTLVHFRPH